MGNEDLSNRTLVVAVLVIAVAYLIYLLSPILTPFLISAILAYIADPLADRLERYRIPRLLSVTIVFLTLSLAALAAFLILAPSVERQIKVFLGKLPGYIDWIQVALLPWLSELLDLEPDVFDLGEIKQTVLDDWQNLGGGLGRGVGYITTSGLGLLNALVTLTLIPIVTFYLLLDWDDIGTVVGRLAREIDEVLGSFLRGQMLVMLSLGIIYCVGLWIIGLDTALPIGLLAGVVSFVPYLGLIVGILVAGVAAVLQFQEFMPVVWVALVFGVGQFVEGMILTPRLVGGRLGLHPVAVIFAVLAGGQLFGFFGVLLALPVAAVVMVWLRFLCTNYKNSVVYNTPDSG
ncbi:MAG: AI-2E family transporter [Gammaproteobacteria bacterium]|nr:AI-2E family transporter [Gammaproteobacteria bacterium]